MQLFQVPNTPDPSSPLHASIFLAGPCPRDSGVQDWRHECVELFKQKGFTGALFWPVPNKNEDQGTFNLDKQVAWETKHLKMADIILFWVPRKIDGAFAGFTTNVEFGLYHSSGKCVMGYPPDAEKMRYIQWWCDKIDSIPPTAQTLPDLVDTCMEKLAALGYQKSSSPSPSTATSVITQNNSLVERYHGEHYIPLILWRSQAFQDWYQNQKAQGNKLLWGDVEYVFTLKRSSKFNFSSAFISILKAHIQIGKENNRVKENEVVVFRPDVSAVVPFYVLEEDDKENNKSEKRRSLSSIKVVLTAEFRTPCRNSVGNQVIEPPSGSSWDHVDFFPTTSTSTSTSSSSSVSDHHKKIALEELHEEADIILSSEDATTRLVYVGSRQVASTLSSHKSHVFAVKLSKNEFEKCVQAEKESKIFGVEEDTERTSIKIMSFEDVLRNGDNGLDWSAVGIISQALMPQVA